MTGQTHSGGIWSRLRARYERLRSGAAQVAAPVADTGRWDLTVDVGVIGLGGAGACAALEARESGASVAVVERFNGGGSTRISGGIVYAGGGTEIQLEAGVDDTPEQMYNYLLHETGDAVCRTTLRRFCEESPANLEWLRERGVPFNASRCPHKTSYPSNLYYLYYSGNEAFAPYTDNARPAPRGHRAHGKGVSGAALFKPLRKALEESGAHILAQSRAVALVQDANGRVTGVQLAMFPRDGLLRRLHAGLYALLIYLRYVAMYAPFVTWLLRAALEGLERHGTRPFRLGVRRGLVLSTGGFFYNRNMVARYAPGSLPGMPLGTIGDDGSGILLGQSVGAATAHMDNVSDWRFVNPPESFIRGILIDARGERICNEMLYGAQLAERINTVADGQAWLLISGALARRALREIGPSRAMWFQSAAALMFLFLARKRAPTLTALAHKLAIPAGNLEQTLAAYNRNVKEGGADPMGKPRDYCEVLHDGPWYALDCRIDGRVRNPSITLGGLCVDEETGAVRDESGVRVPGLYAAGRSAVGIASHSYVSGLSIAGCIFSGRRAGRHAAQ